MKILFVPPLILFFALTVKSQDYITTTDGNRAQVQVNEVDDNMIKYHRWDNLDGPIYTLDKANILRIDYQNGTYEIFNNPPPNNNAAPGSNPPPDNATQPAPQSALEQPPTPAPPPQPPPPPPAPVVSCQSYYNELSPYGQWLNNPMYGYVWVPSAGPSFTPYGSGGHWVLTNMGWTWVSDYPWGWCTFHYGRWDYDAFMGWFWIPGYEWAPAWVSWRSYNGYYGWAPLGPTYAEGGYSTYVLPPQRYVFVRSQYITSPSVTTYYEPASANQTYLSQSTVVNNTQRDNNSNVTYLAGPAQSEVEHYTGAPVQRVSLVSSATPEHNGVNGAQLALYRPAAQPPPKNAPLPVPAKVYQKEEIAPVAQRQTLTQPGQARKEPFKPEVMPQKQQQEQQKQQQLQQQQEQQKQQQLQQQQKQQEQQQQEQQKQQQLQQQQKQQQVQQQQKQQQVQQQQKQQQMQQPSPQPQPKQQKTKQQKNKQPKQPKPKPPPPVQQEKKE